MSQQSRLAAVPQRGRGAARLPGKNPAAGSAWQPDWQLPTAAAAFKQACAYRELHIGCAATRKSLTPPPNDTVCSDCWPNRLTARISAHTRSTYAVMRSCVPATQSHRPACQTPPFCSPAAADLSRLQLHGNSSKHLHHACLMVLASEHGHISRCTEQHACVRCILLKPA